ncbi:hypothetical protein [Pilimelia terevasa]|nr:hypothetical protein [Pilimelia terevasa]
MTSRHPVPGTCGARRAASLAAAAVLAAGLLAGCGGNNSDTRCDLNSCTVTFNGVDASASILGVEAKVLGVQGEQVTLQVAGQQATLNVGQQAVDVGGFQATLQSADADRVVVRIARP